MWLFALLCAVIGLLVGGFDIKFVVPPLEWFLLGVLFACLSSTEIVFPFQRRQ